LTFETYDLVGKLLNILKDPRPQGLQLCLNLIRTWCNQIENEIINNRRPEDEVLRLWRILCPQESQAHIEAGFLMPSTVRPLPTVDSWTKWSTVTWESPEHLRTVLKFVSDHWYDYFLVPGEPKELL